MSGGAPTVVRFFGEFLRNDYPFRPKTCILVNKLTKFKANLE